MEWEEFKRVTRYIEPEFFDSANLSAIFNQYAEFDEENEKSVSLEGFSKLAKELTLFKPESLQRFLDKNTKGGFVKTIEELKDQWPRSLENHITGLLQKAGELKPEMQIFIFKLGKLIKGFEPKIKDKVWLNYNLLEAESIRLYQDNYILPKYIAEELLCFGEALIF
jgi:hypothetical protein